MGILEDTARKTQLLASSRYAVSKIDTWDRQTKLNFIKAYDGGDWDTVNNLTSNATGSALTRNLKIGTLADIIREQEAK